MSVIVRGMKMPKDCFECMVDCPVGTQRFIVTGRPRGCPLVEIPTPHGKLGDLDKLEERFKRVIETYIPTDPTRHMDVDTSNRCHAWCNGLTVIQDAKIVIEAEGATDA